MKSVIEDAILPAAEHPYLFRPGRVPGTREIVAHPNYIIVYRVAAERIEVTNVLHARLEYPYPAPDGRPGFIRIDSVHQGDQDGVKGVHHINAVDCVTQQELVATCEKITEVYLLPVIEALLDAFPFRILDFHADNGPEYINHQVAKMLDQLAAAKASSITHTSAAIDGRSAIRLAMSDRPRASPPSTRSARRERGERRSADPGGGQRKGRTLQRAHQQSCYKLSR